MNWSRNPWLGALVALGALGIYARVETPLAALAIGLPFAVMTWAYWCFGHRLNSTQGVTAAPSPKRFSNVISLVVPVLLAVWFLYLVYGVITGKGVIGWLNAVQAARAGKFSTKLSFITGIVYMLCGGGVIALVWDRLDRWVGGPGPLAAATQGPQPGPAVPSAPPAVSDRRRGTRLALWMFVAIAAGTWVIGTPAYLWIAAEHREDAQARYVTVDLGARTVSWPQETHVSLRGVPQGDQVLVLKRGNDSHKTYFVPMTGEGWTPALPVQAVLTFEGESAAHLDRLVLGRLRRDGLPRAAVEAFEREGVKIDASHRLVEWVPSVQGQVLDRGDSDRETFLIGASLISVISLLGASMFWLVTKFKHRSLKAA